jgi:hypothetical protein
LWAELELFSSYSDLSKATFYDYNESKKDKRNKSILRSLAGIGSFLKGLELEVRIVDWFNSKIDKKGIKTV